MITMQLISSMTGMMFFDLRVSILCKTLPLNICKQGLVVSFTIFSNTLYYVPFQISIYEENSLQPYRYHGNSYAASLLAILVASVAVGFSFVPFLIGLSTEQDQLEHQLISIAYILECIYTIVLAATCLWFIWKYKQLVNVGRVRLSQHRVSEGHLQMMPSNSQTHQESHSSSFQIVLFGIGSIAYFICYLVKVAATHPIDIMQIIDKCLLLACIILFIIFLRLYKDVSLKTCRLFQYSIALMIGAVTWTWIYITVQPLWIHFRDNSTSITPNISDHGDLLKLDLETVTEIAESFLQPFYVEFLSISAGCLLCLWFKMRTDQDHLSHTDYDENSNLNVETSGQNRYFRDYGALLARVNEESLINNRYSEKKTTHKIQKRIVIGLSVVMGTGYFISMQLSTVGPFTKWSQSLQNTPRTVITRIVESAVYLPLIVLNLVSIRKLQNSNVNISKIQQYTSSDNLLLLTTAVQFGYRVLRAIAAIGVVFVGSISANGTLLFYAIFILFSFTPIWTQTHLIMSANYVYRSVYKLPKVVEFTLIYVLVINIAEWLYISIAHKWVENEFDLHVYAPEFVTTYGNFNTKAILLAFDPIIAMYSFHSVVAVYHILRVKND